MPAPGDRPVVLLPLGATEQHGPHLPTDVDTRIAVEAVRVLAVNDAGATSRAVPVAPMPFGSSGEHQAFAGTVSIGTAVLAEVLVELGRSIANWTDRLLVINAHGGNVDALRTAIPRLRHEGRDAAWVTCRSGESDTDTHAGHAETSLMLALAPDTVRVDLAIPGNTAPLREILPAMRSGGVAAVSPSGVLGDPTTATAAEGWRLWRALHDDLATKTSRWQPGEDGMLR